MPFDIQGLRPLKNILDQLVTHPTGAFALLLSAAFSEVFADSFFQIGLHRSTGLGRVFAFGLGVAFLALYGLMVNFPNWDFGRLLGMYAVLFFLIAQILAKIRFNQSPSTPIYVGGALICAGGMVIAFWK